MSGFLGKYSRILIVIIVFLILVLSVLGANFYNSFKVEKDASLVNAIGEQGALSQRISKSLLQTLNSYTSSENYSENLVELSESSEKFNSGLALLSSNSNLKKINKNSVQNVSKSWEPLLSRIGVIQQRLAEDKKRVDGGENTIQSVLTRLGASRGSTQALEQLMTGFATEKMEERDSKSAFVIERSAVLVLKLEELLFVAESKYYKGLEISDEVSNIEAVTAQLDAAIKILKNENSAVVSGNSSSKQAENLSQIDTLWSPLKSDAKDFVTVSKEKAQKVTVPSLLLDALTYSNTNMNDVANEMESLTGEVAFAINKSADTSRLIQILGIIGSSLCFLYILGAFFGQLKRSDEEIQVVQRESDKIFETIDQGVFLLSESSVIGNQYSQKLLEIFGVEDVGNKQVLKFLKDFVSEEDLGKLSRYIKLLFNPHKKAKLIEDLNPLSEVTSQVFQDGRMVTKHLSFNFSRVIANEKVENVLASVTDISREVQLREKLDQESKRGEQQINLLSTLLNTNAEMLPSFIQNSNQAYDQINNTLRSDSKSLEEYREKADKIGVLVHMIKGESSSLGIGIVADACHEFENELMKIKENHHVDGNNFLPLTILLERMIGYNKVISELNERVFSKQAYSPEGNNIASDLKDIIGTNLETSEAVSKDVSWSHLFDFAQEIADRENKSVNFKYSGLEAANVNKAFSGELSTLTSQFLRNAIVHGIESESVRIEKGKQPIGQVSVSLYKENNGYVFECSDDGNGVDVDILAQRAVEKGFLEQEDIDSLSQSKLMSLLFKQGFSTKDSVDEDSGRGMGLAAIHDTVKKLNGRIGIATKAGEFTRFSIYFPYEDLDQEAG